MPALKPTRITGKIVFMGSVPHRNDPEICTDILHEMPLSFAGYEPDVHSGVTRPSCSRVLSQHPRDTEIKNTRQISIVSAEEIAEIAQKLGLSEIDPRWLGASIVVSGIPDFTHLPPSSRLQSSNGTTLCIGYAKPAVPFPGDDDKDGDRRQG